MNNQISPNSQETQNQNQKVSKTPEERKETRYTHLKSLLTKISRLKAEAIQLMHKLNYNDDVIKRTVGEIAAKVSAEETAKTERAEIEKYGYLSPMHQVYLEQVLLDNELHSEFRYLLKNS